jgi:hypothetical protein
MYSVSSAFGCRWMSCFAPGGNTVIPNTQLSAPTLSEVTSHFTSMSIQPSLARSEPSLGVPSTVTFIGCSLRTVSPSLTGLSSSRQICGQWASVALI